MAERHAALLPLLLLLNLSSGVGQTACQPGTVELDFFQACAGSNADGTAKPRYNNLKGFGPRFSDPEEIRYEAIGTINGLVFDLVLRATSSYYTGNPSNNGCNGQFGQISVWVSNCFSAVRVTRP